MLQKEEVEKLLAEAYSAEMFLLGEMSYLYRGKLTHKLVMRSYMKNKTEKLCVNVEAQENLYPSAWEKMQEVAAAQVYNEENYMICIVGSGVWNMNPALVELHFHDTHMEITAWAKEGIIKQHTAEKAIQICLTALGLA